MTWRDLIARLARTLAVAAVAAAPCLTRAQAGTQATPGCPIALPGQPLPEAAQATYLENQGWRDIVSRLDAKIAATDLSQVRLLFLGDSITEAWDPTVFAQHYGVRNALNLGVRGDTTAGLLWRLPRMKLGSALRPELIVLLIGTNNTWPNGDAAAVAIAIGEVVRTIRGMAPESRILLVGILPRGPDDHDPWRRMAVDVNQRIANCADGRHVFYTDPGHHLVDRSGHLAPDLAADLLHPTPRGYAILSDALEPEIARLLR